MFCNKKSLSHPMSEKGYFFMLLVSFSVTDIPIPPSGFFQKSNRNNKNTDVIIIHNSCLNLDNGCKVKEKRCNCKIFVRIIAEKISKTKKMGDANSCSSCVIWNGYFEHRNIERIFCFYRSNSNIDSPKAKENEPKKVHLTSIFKKHSRFEFYFYRPVGELKFIL